MTDDTEHLFMFIFHLCIFGELSSEFFVHSVTGWLVFSSVSVSSLYSLETSLLSVVRFPRIFSLSDLSFHSLKSFTELKFLI